MRYIDNSSLCYNTRNPMIPQDGAMAAKVAAIVYIHSLIYLSAPGQRERAGCGGVLNIEYWHASEGTRAREAVAIQML